MIQIDSQTLKIKWQIIQRKIRHVRKTMSKQSTNLCKQALIEGQSTCGGEDLLTECIEWCKKFEIRCVTLGVEKEKAQAENLKFNKAFWRENYREIRAEMDKLSKVKDLKMPTTKRERNYLKGTSWDELSSHQAEAVSLNLV